MSIYDKLFEQGKKPRGLIGRITGWLMNVFHVPFYRILMEQVPVEEGHIILDVGCGAGQSLAMLAQKVPAGKVCGIDHSPEMVQMASSLNRELINEGRIEVIEASVSSLPYEKATFDLVVASETIHFWPDLSNDLREIYRVLKHGGSLVVVNKYARNEKEAATLSRHFTLHSPEDFQKVLVEAGFHVAKIELMEKKGQLIIVGRKEGEAVPA
ncbi:MAG TPA: class I SAM-dependent methyltransferase [Synergistales bacterium]|nr:class I SAM-dependent methyltransferase [Synergistales bacterium]